MKFILILMLAGLTIENVANAQPFKTGDTVIYQDRYTSMKGTVLEVENNGALNIEFADAIKNTVYSHQVNSNYLRFYRHVEQLVVHNYFFIPIFTLTIGEKVIYKDSATWMKGTVIDLTADGKALVDFNDSILNSVYGNYLSAYEFLTPGQ